jgi:hypothetical protein
VCPDDEEGPPPARVETDQNITDDVGEDTADLADNVGGELGGGATRAPVPTSPTSNQAAVVARRRPLAPTQPPPPAKRARVEERTRTVVESGVDNTKNSEEFPVEVRPVLFKDNRLFDKLSFESAASIVWDFQQTLDKKKLFEKKKGEKEKSDDKLPLVKIPAGEDDAMNRISDARKLLRPVNKEIKEQMSWLPTAWKEIVRNLPLRVYGLDDCVSAKDIEQCHDLSSKIEIKQFSPTNLRNAAKSTRQTAFADNDGKLVLENDDVYGTLETTNDVVLAFNTLASIWQKLHPHWPVANIGLRVCFAMKLFCQCGDQARDTMIEWANRYLQANASRAASGEGPMSYERAYCLAGTVCRDRGYEKEPPAAKNKNVGNAEQSRGGAGGGGGRGGRGGRGGGARGGGRGRGGVSGGNTRTYLGFLLPNGEGLCKFWQTGNCHDQGAASCNRAGVIYKHLCDFPKGNSYCQGSHKKPEHDPTKH